MTSNDYNRGHIDGIRTAAQLLAEDYSKRADLLTGDARQAMRDADVVAQAMAEAMRDAAVVAQAMADGNQPGSAPARGGWPIKRGSA